MCGIGKVLGLDVHDSIFGTHMCVVTNWHRLCFLIWSEGWREDVVFQRFVGGLTAVELFYGISRKDIDHIVEFFKWLNDDVNSPKVPSRVRMVLTLAHILGYCNMETNI